MARDRTAKRSPLKERPLRLPGQSIQDEIDHHAERFVQYALITIAAWGLAGYEWLRCLVGRPPPLGAELVIAALVTVVSIVKLRRSVSTVRMLKLAMEGERIVAEQLDGLKRSGATVLHDVVANGFNLDHIILCRKGVFVAETKTRSKRVQGSPSVQYDGEVLLVDGLKPDRDPVAQVQANAKWLADELRKGTGKHYAVKPVVLFPGWWVEPVPKGARVWVLEPKALPKFIENEPPTVTEPDLQAAVYHLVRIARLYGS